MHVSRRTLLGGTLGVAALERSHSLHAADQKQLKLAAIVTEYRENSHADVIVSKFLEGCRTPEVTFTPRVKVASLYLDQTPTDDMGKEMAAKHAVALHPTIDGALCLGGKELAVDGVLLIGEHGRYPYNELGQHLYPRRRFFEETAAVFRRSGRAVPVFNDKHLSPVWADAKWMYDTARELKVPFLAGSSLPLTWLKPAPDLPVGSPLTEALAVGYGPTEAYGFHALEALQCLAERRKGGEAGMKSVQCLSGADVWAAGEAGRWSWPLAQAALSRSERAEVRGSSLKTVRERTSEPECFLVEYRGGFKGTVLMLPGVADEFLFSGRVEGRAEPVSTLFWLQDGKPFIHFARLCQAIEEMILTGKPPYPVERTLLTTGILDAAMRSRHGKGVRIQTPELGVRY